MSLYHVPTTTPFIGMDEVLAEIMSRLCDPACRLLTLIGPGGMGKTRLAVEIGRRISEDHRTSLNENAVMPDGVYFVALQSLTTPDLIPHAIAEVLELQFYDGESPEYQLTEFVKSRHMLLILDNFEHLLDGTDLISLLLAAAPNLKCLVTSREALNLHEEWLTVMPGMPYPSDANDNHLAEYAAVRLFVQQASRMRPDFTLETEREAVARICHLLEGTPLAIEMAACWVRALTCAEIAAEIERGLDILQSPARNIPARHRSMRAVLDQSWLLLSEDDRCAMAWLAVFQGGFVRQAAEAITGATMLVLSTLLDKSWLRWGESRSAIGGQGRQYTSRRYEIHELLHQYATEKLTEGGDAEAAHAAHAHYYAVFMQQREEDVKGRRQLEALAEIELELENVRAAWQWASRCNDWDVIDQMVESLYLFFDMTGRFIEGAALLQVADEAITPLLQAGTSLTAQRLHLRYLRLLTQTGRISTLDLRPDIFQSLTVLQTLNAPLEVAFAYCFMGQMSFHWDNWASGEVALQEAEVIVRRQNDRFLLAVVLAWQGLFCQSNNNYQKMHRCLRESLLISQAEGNLNETRWTLTNLAIALGYQNQIEEAEAAFAEAMRLHAAFGDQLAPIWCLIVGASLAIIVGNFTLAYERIALVQQHQARYQDPGYDYFAEGNLALLSILFEDYNAAAEWSQQASPLDNYSTYFSANQWRFVRVILALQEGDIEGAQDYLMRMLVLQSGHKFSIVQRLWLAAPAAALLAWQQGDANRAVELLALTHLDMPPVGWIERAPLFKRIRAELEATLGPESFALAWERGRHLSVEEMFNRLLGVEPKPLIIAPSELTTREIEILGLIAEGQSNREIAETLVLTVGTVKWYVNQVYSKLGVGSRTQAVARARELKLI